MSCLFASQFSPSTPFGLKCLLQTAVVRWSTVECSSFRKPCQFESDIVKFKYCLIFFFSNCLLVAIHTATALTQISNYAPLSLSVAEDAQWPVNTESKLVDLVVVGTTMSRSPLGSTELADPVRLNKQVTVVLSMA
jgi:hypothetical protein